MDIEKKTVIVIRSDQKRAGDQSLMETFYCLKKKEVINVCDGQRLGFVQDLELDLCNGRICALLVPVGTTLFGLLRPQRWYRIRWECIRRMGDDVILVDIVPEKNIIEL